MTITIDRDELKKVYNKRRKKYTEFSKSPGHETYYTGLLDGMQMLELILYDYGLKIRTDPNVK